MFRKDFLKASAIVTITWILIAAPLDGEHLPATAGVADTAPMSIPELQNLVAPIALYPDPLVAQILAAATFPDQLAVANYWLQQHKSLTGQSLMRTVNRESWDASVKALTQFPSVLENMAHNLVWTSTLGEAYHNQRTEVMSAIQGLRAKAEAQGRLMSGPQITVTQASPQIITIEPTNPGMVYVPLYDPDLIYGAPYITPDYTPLEVATGSLLGFGSGIALGAFAAGGCCGWGWGSWNANWSAGSVTYNHNTFVGNRSWHGGYYNGQYHGGYGYQNAYDRAVADAHGSASRMDDFNRAERNLNEHGISSPSWARADSEFHGTNAFSGFDHRLGAGGWDSRAQSFRGWGSLRSGGFGGGRFGGGGFGGGRFGGFHGGFRR